MKTLPPLIQKHAHIGTVFIFLAFVFIFLYGIGPNYVGDDGVVHEWFGFIPLAYCSLAIGILVHVLKSINRHKK